MSTTEPSEKIELDKLRENDHESWGRASLELYSLVARVLKIVIPHATQSEVKDHADPIIANIATQIMRPKTESFVLVKSWDDVLNLSAKITRQSAIDVVRKNEVRQRETNIEHVEVVESERQNSATPREKASSNELRVLLHEALNSLNKDDEKLLTNFYFEGKGTRQIAEEYGTTNGAICPKLSTARNRWGAALQELGVDINELQA